MQIIRVDFPLKDHYSFIFKEYLNDATFDGETFSRFATFDGETFSRFATFDSEYIKD